MSSDRQKAFSSIANTNLEVIFINKDNLSSWILKNAPLHEAYKFLSAVHKADYLRCYFMHNYGGAYSDVKVIEDSWLPAYQELNDNHFLINGFRERSCFDAARGRGLIKDLWLALNFYRIIGTNAYVCKPNTAFTKEWMASINNILDQKYELLTHNPAEHPRDFYCKKFDDGHVSNYPLRWTEICGEVFHPLCLKYSKEILKSLPAPAFHESYL